MESNDETNKKYFKITNEQENHNGYQYVDGLNVLNMPFAEEGSCVPGGFYFTDAENILFYLSYGIYLREISLPETDPDFKMVKDPEDDKWRANKIILGKRYNLSDISTFEYLIQQGAEGISFNYVDNICDYRHPLAGSFPFGSIFSAPPVYYSFI